MSAFSDGLRLLEGEANAFALLPAVNQGYIFWKTTNPSLTQNVIVLGSLLVSVTAFNIITHGDFHQYGLDSETMEIKYALLLIGITVIWTVALAISVIQLYEYLSPNKPWPVLLLALSLLFVSMLITHVILSRALPMYDSD